MLHRHTGIQMHPKSISSLILPGNYIHRITSRGKEQKQFVELEHGYFWMIKDLKRSNEKPVLSNDSLIAESQAKLFPTLKGLKSLTGEKVDLPDYMTRRNRSHDAAAQCTLVAISFRDFGFQQLPSVRDGTIFYSRKSNDMSVDYTIPTTIQWKRSCRSDENQL